MLNEQIKLRQEIFQVIGDLSAEIEAATQCIYDAVISGHKVLACGNGGSAAEAQHFSTELIGRYRTNRISLPSVALNADGTALTCIGNDFGWENMFARQVEGLGQPGDVLLGLTTSGNSANVLQAIHAAHSKEMKTVALLGKGGGKAKGLCTHEIVVPSDLTAVIQEAHLFLIHYFCEAIEAHYTAAN